MRRSRLRRSKRVPFCSTSACTVCFKGTCSLSNVSSNELTQFHLSFLTGLHHHGYVFSTPATDDLILRLEALLLSFSPSADPLAFLHAIDTPPQYPATSFTSTDLPIPPTNAFLSGSSLLPASDPTLTVNAEVADYGRIISEAISGAASASDWSGAAGGGSFSDGGGVGPEAESMHAWAPW